MAFETRDAWQDVGSLSEKQRCLTLTSWPYSDNELRKYLWIESAKLAARKGRQSEVYQEENAGWCVDSFLVDESKIAMFKLSAGQPPTKDWCVAVNT